MQHNLYNIADNVIILKWNRSGNLDLHRTTLFDVTEDVMHS